MDKKTIVIISISVIVLIIILFITYRLAKNTVKPDNIQVGNDDYGTSVFSNDEKIYINSLAKQLYNEMDGYNFSRDELLYSELKLLSDTKLVALSNVFNLYYQGASGENFVSWLSSEQFYYHSYNVQHDVDTVLERLSNLGVH